MSARQLHAAGVYRSGRIPQSIFALLGAAVLFTSLLFITPDTAAQSQDDLQLPVEIAPEAQLELDAETAPEPEPEPVPVTDEIEVLKQQLLELNRDLLILEEELLYPANNQIALYLSIDVGEYFQLDSVKVHIDDQLVASELYTEHQVDALFRGGVQRLYVGNLKTGDHELTAFFIGIGPQGREYKRATSIAIDKQTSGKVYELKIIDSGPKQQPVFSIKEWQL